MKLRSKTSTLIIALCMVLAKSNAQENKLQTASIFSKLSNTVVFNESEIKRSLDFAKGENVVLNITTELKIKGKVISNNKKSNHIQQMIVSSPELNNSLVQITKITQPNSPVQYAGHIINKDAGEGYRLIKNEKGEYVFSKYSLKNVLQVCSQ